MKKNKLLALTSQEIKWVEEEAEKKELTFSDMMRRIIDDRYEKQEEERKSNSGKI
jgi:hypothetical protein